MDRDTRHGCSPSRNINVHTIPDNLAMPHAFHPQSSIRSGSSNDKGKGRTNLQTRKDNIVDSRISTEAVFWLHSEEIDALEPGFGFAGLKTAPEIRARPTRFFAL